MRLPQRALTLSTKCRVVASSMTSSWYSDPRCTSSQATPPSIDLPGDRGVDPAGTAVNAAAMAKAGRWRLPPALIR